MKTLRGTVFIFLVLLIGMWRFSRMETTMPTALLLSIDSNLSKNEQEKLVSMFAGQKVEPIVPLIRNIKSQFSTVQSITAQRKSSNNVKVIIEGIEPKAFVNSDLILGSSGDLLRKSSYDALYIKALPGLTASRHAVQDKYFSVQLLSFLKTHGTSLLRDFDITWVRSTEIALCDKEIGDFIVLCDRDHVPDGACLRACRYIYTELKPNPEHSIITDIRFDNQIIAYVEQNSLLKNNSYLGMLNWEGTK